jgi:phosphohistidine phosphatase
MTARPARRLMLLRHAKSDWPAGVDDKDRPLAPRGRRACVQLGEALVAGGLRPDLVLCSSALRTRQTVERLAAALPPDVPVVVEDRLYLAAPGDLLERLHDLDDGVPSVLLVGHNPGVHALARLLLPRAERDCLPTFPTAALAVQDAAVARWADLGPGTTRLVSFTTPRSLARD